MKVILRAKYWPKELKEGQPIVSMEPENEEEKRFCEKIVKDGYAYGSTFTMGKKEIFGVEVILMKKL